MLLVLSELLVLMMLVLLLSTKTWVQTHKSMHRLINSNLQHMRTYVDKKEFIMRLMLYHLSTVEVIAFHSGLCSHHCR